MLRSLLIAFERLQNFNFWLRRTLIALSALSLSCSNALSNFADKGDDQALYYEVLEHIRQSRFSAAIDTCAEMSTEFVETPKVLQLCAEAYAGRCGFRILDMVNDLDTYLTTTPSEKLFHWLMTKVGTTTAAQATDCESAMSLLYTIGTASLRTRDQNALMVMLSLHSIAATLDVAGDRNTDTPLDDDDGVLDPGFDDACGADLTNEQAEQIGAAFWHLKMSVYVLAASGEPYATLDTSTDALCTAMDWLAGGAGDGLCGATSPSALNAVRLLNARSLIAEGSVVGVDQAGCNGGTIVDPGCNCP
jgi:hypothetical protein